VFVEEPSHAASSGHRADNGNIARQPTVMFGKSGNKCLQMEANVELAQESHKGQVVVVLVEAGATVATAALPAKQREVKFT